jgi:hypothetical protein
MKYLCEFMSESGAAVAAVLWFVSASIRLKKPNRIRQGLESGFDDPKTLLVMVYKQSRWSAWRLSPLVWQPFLPSRTDFCPVPGKGLF